jgi:hypothetical protein
MNFTSTIQFGFNRPERRAAVPRALRTARPARGDRVGGQLLRFPAEAVGADGAEAGPALTWVHDGALHRVSVWPDVVFQRRSVGGRWLRTEPSEAALASAALGVSAAKWKRFLEFVPAAEREWLGRFGFDRMAALLVRVRCPELFEELRETPALVAFLASHRSLRGGDAPAWDAVGAVFEREGIFGVLQWLGLPASRQTLGILRQIAEPDLPRRLVEPLRSALWEPEAIWALAHTPELTEARLAAACHALAA